MKVSFEGMVAMVIRCGEDMADILREPDDARYPSDREEKTDAVVEWERMRAFMLALKSEEPELKAEIERLKALLDKERDDTAEMFGTHELLPPRGCPSCGCRDRNGNDCAYCHTDVREGAR